MMTRGAGPWSVGPSEEGPACAGGPVFPRAHARPALPPGLRRSPCHGLPPQAAFDQTGQSGPSPGPDRVGRGWKLTRSEGDLFRFRRCRSSRGARSPPQEEPAVVTSAVRIFADIEQRERSRLLGDAPPGVVDRTPVLIFLEPQWESAEAREAVVAGEGALRLAGENCKCRATKILARGRRRQFCEARVPLCYGAGGCLLVCLQLLSELSFFALSPGGAIPFCPPPGDSINWPRRTKPAAIRSPMRLLGGAASLARRRWPRPQTGASLTVGS